MGDLLADQIFVQIAQNITLPGEILLHPAGAHAAADVTLPGVLDRLRLRRRDVLVLGLVVEIALRLVCDFHRAVERLIGNALCQRLLAPEHHCGHCDRENGQACPPQNIGKNRSNMHGSV